MPISRARQAAYRILRRVESGRDFAVDLLQSAQVSELKEADRRLATEIVMGTLRQRGELDDYWLVEYSGKKLNYFDPEVITILRLGLYQILFLDKIPKSAAVNESVELVKVARKRSAAGLVNAVLRKAGPLHQGPRGKTPEGKTLAADEVRALPAWLAECWAENFGEEGMKSLALASLQVPPTTLRAADGAGREEIQMQLALEGITTRPGRYSSQALIVETGNLQTSPMLRAGRVLIQDEASQLVASLVAPRAGDRVLDLCAAPGLKTAQLAMALGSGLCVACDLSARRLRTMRSLLPNTSPAAVHVLPVRMDAAQTLCFNIMFDRILLDAPCSGTGTLARNPEIKWRLQPEDLGRLAELQAKMLHNALHALAPGGRLVYATCSLEPEENERVIEKIFKISDDFRLLPHPALYLEFPSLAPLFDSQGYFHTRPDRHGMDGFFAAVMHRMP